MLVWHAKLDGDHSDHRSALFLQACWCFYKSLTHTIIVEKKYVCITCLMNSSSCSTNDSNAFATSTLNLNKNKQWSSIVQIHCMNIHVCISQAYLSVSSSVTMTLSLNLGSALFSHQNLWVFLLCSGLKPDTFKKSVRISWNDLLD